MALGSAEELTAPASSSGEGGCATEAICRWRIWSPCMGRTAILQRLPSGGPRRLEYQSVAFCGESAPQDAHARSVPPSLRHLWKCACLRAHGAGERHTMLRSQRKLERLPGSTGLPELSREAGGGPAWALSVARPY